MELSEVLIAYPEEIGTTIGELLQKIEAQQVAILKADEMLIEESRRFAEFLLKYEGLKTEKESLERLVSFKTDQINRLRCELYNFDPKWNRIEKAVDSAWERN